MVAWKHCYLVVTLFLATATSAGQAAPKRVLLLNSFGRDVAPFSTAASACRTTLARELGERVEFWEVSLDMARAGDAEMKRATAEYLASQIRNRPVDLVVSVGAPALRFAATRREYVFPTAPLVFTGAEPRMVRPEFLRPNATMVVHTLNMPGMVDDMLGLHPEATEFHLTFSAQAATNREIALQTRSLMHIISAMAIRTEVPPTHIAEGRTLPGIPDLGRADTDQGQIRIRCTKGRPAHAFVEPHYRDHWFWVDDRDLRSKRAFSFVMLLFTLAETGDPANLPLITIPAQ